MPITFICQLCGAEVTLTGASAYIQEEYDEYEMNIYNSINSDSEVCDDCLDLAIILQLGYNSYGV